MGHSRDAQGRVTVILGAGASRAVSYANEMSAPSPLDGDFFDILQRLEVKGDQPWKVKLRESKKFVLNAVANRMGDALWQSLERMFYTLHVSAVLEHKLFPERFRQDPAKSLLKHFTRALQGTLRAAHGMKTCEYHVRLFQRLRGQDGILTFNYDLVPERALKQLHEKGAKYGRWVYGFESKPDGTDEVPTLHKLHGSANWKFVIDTDGEFRDVRLRQSSWDDLSRIPGYLATGPSFPILLPYWEKRIEHEPWRSIWKRAASQLAQTQILIVWGYSLPLTDVKAHELLRLSLQHGSILA